MLRFSSMKRLCFQMNNKLSADGWRRALQSVSPTVEEINFSACDLEGEKVAHFPELMLRFSSMKRLCFQWYNKLSADGWRRALQSVSPTVEEINFSACDLEDEKVAHFPALILRFTSMKRLCFDWNKKLSADGWRRALQSASPTV